MAAWGGESPGGGDGRSGHSTLQCRCCHHSSLLPHKSFSTSSKVHKLSQTGFGEAGLAEASVVCRGELVKRDARTQVTTS